VGHGYFIRVPARAWYTWSGELLEEKGVVPDYAVNANRDEGDVLLERAVEVVRGL
jgi:C-terminal processing protease CtpA/Prc